MTSNEIFKILKKGIKFTRHMECVKSGYGCKKGEKYTEECTVYEGVKWVKRSLEEPPRYKMAMIEAVHKDNDGKKRKGYFDLTSKHMNACDIEFTNKGFRLIQKPDPNFNYGLWIETYELSAV